MLVVVLTMGMFYAGIGLVAIYDPVLVFIDQNLIISLSFVMMSILFYGHSSHFILRLLSIAGSSIIGEFLLGIPLNKIGFVYILGGPVYLDTLAISFGGLIVLKTLGEMNQVFNIKALTNKGEMKNL
ncbi:hypothetical protein FGG79_00935 [Bacillus sp. BHET2]|uniref:YphA family membrane protein n=1 Tax=Bacillus sp. BHET2 TaxID=2583818 RepID=UPI00110DA673|nr:hypothetical protein [Bacillus sp. BHET2]TMU86745.1 hypothetical protein FGG79_00935 [Bacillus sp. BHET2]